MMHSSSSSVHNVKETLTLESLLNAINKNHDELNSTLKTTNSKIDGFVAELSEKIEIAKKELHVKIENVENYVDNQVSTLENRLLATELALDRYKRNGDFLIYGLPYSDKENLENIFNIICTKINFSCTHSNVKIYRIGKRPSGSKPPPVLVKFNDHFHAQQFFSNYLSCTPALETNTFGFSNAARIFINKSLTKHDIVIYKKCVELKKNHIIHQVFTDNGLVSVKKDRLSKKNYFSTMAEFETFLISINSSHAQHPPVLEYNTRSRSSKRKPSSPTYINQQSKTNTAHVPSSN